MLSIGAVGSRLKVRACPPSGCPPLPAIRLHHLRPLPDASFSPPNAVQTSPPPLIAARTDAVSVPTRFPYRRRRLRALPIAVWLAPTPALTPARTDADFSLRYHSDSHSVADAAIAACLTPA
jgi:hypothetical protein